MKKYDKNEIIPMKNDDVIEVRNREKIGKT